MSTKQLPANHSHVLLPIRSKIQIHDQALIRNSNFIEKIYTLNKKIIYPH